LPLLIAVLKSRSLRSRAGGQHTAPAASPVLTAQPRAGRQNRLTMLLAVLLSTNRITERDSGFPI